MNKIFITFLAFAIIAIFLVTGCAQPAAPTASPAPAPATSAAKPAATPTPTQAASTVYKIRFADELAPGDYRSVAPKKWAKYLNENSGGRLNVEYFDSASLYKATESVEAVSIGACEAVMAPGQSFARLVREWEAISVPAVITSLEMTYKIIDGELGARLLKNLENKGLKGIAITHSGWGGEGGFVATKPIRKPADLKGLKVRAPNKLIADVVAAQGGTPATVAGSELFMAFKLGTIDAAGAGYQHYRERLLHEAGAIYLNQVPVNGWMPFVIAMNKNYFEKLPADLQKLILESGKKMLDIDARQPAVQEMENNKKFAEDKGVKTIVPTAEEYALWVKAVAPAVETVKGYSPEVKTMVELLQNFK